MFTSSLRRSLLSRPTAFAAAPRAINVTRPLSQSSQLFARKDAQGKDDMTIESNEYSKSGSDAASASVEKAAFDPKSTSPEEEHDTAGREAEHKSGGADNNPLNVSPANHEVSYSQHSKEGGQGSAAQGQTTKDRGKTSGGGSAQKHGGGKYGGGGGGS